MGAVLAKWKRFVESGVVTDPSGRKLAYFGFFRYPRLLSDAQDFRRLHLAANTLLGSAAICVAICVVLGVFLLVDLVFELRLMPVSHVILVLGLVSFALLTGFLVSICLTYGLPAARDVPDRYQRNAATSSFGVLVSRFWLSVAVVLAFIGILINFLYGPDQFAWLAVPFGIVLLVLLLDVWSEFRALTIKLGARNSGTHAS